VYNAVYLVSVEHDMPMRCPTNDGTVVCGPTCVGVSLSPSLGGLSRDLQPLSSSSPADACLGPYLRQSTVSGRGTHESHENLFDPISEKGRERDERSRKKLIDAGMLRRCIPEYEKAVNYDR